MKRKIGIIGAGKIGATLTGLFTRLEHDVLVANSRGPVTLVDVAKETGAKPVSLGGAPRGRDLMVVTIPEGKIFDAAGVRRALAQATPERKPEWCASPKNPGTHKAPA